MSFNKIISNNVSRVLVKYSSLSEVRSPLAPTAVAPELQGPTTSRGLVLGLGSQKTRGIVPSLSISSLLYQIL
ncbi:hypothetical protein AAHA92_00301 [Salvia divinorum]|uniref:Uncharacterized protein n=1 Tax=Salvia divinorum TaxID=28513 RepID=A0ABD1IJ38_SALDI